MSVLGIASTALSQLGNIQSKFQQVQGEFKTLGQDLKAGNLAQAQTDFVTLSQSVTSQLTSSSPVAKAVNAVGQALQSGDLTAAQQAFASIPPTMVGPSAVHHHHTPPSQNLGSLVRPGVEHTGAGATSRETCRRRNRHFPPCNRVGSRRRNQRNTGPRRSAAG